MDSGKVAQMAEALNGLTAREALGLGGVHTDRLG
jgi:hypothetical protein